MIRIATRGSELALAQTGLVRRNLALHTRDEIDLVVIKTQGDREQEASFRNMEGVGFFTKDIEAALLERRADLAVHSLKDLPTSVPSGLMIVPILEREDPSELLLARRDARDGSRPLGLKAGARVGTSAVRRHAQLRALRPDLQLCDLRGNVPTRIRRLKEGAYDAILIARAGVNRLALDIAPLEACALPPQLFLPAPGQGMLALELRTEDAVLRALAERLTIEPDRRLVEAERELLALFDGGCGLPLGAHARACEGGYELFAALGPRPLPDPGIDVSLVHAHVRASDPRELAPLAYEELLSRDFERDAGQRTFALLGRRIVLTGTPRHVQALGQELMQRGAHVIACETITPVFEPDQERLTQVLDSLPSFDWILFRSITAVEMFAPLLREAGGSKARIGAIGSSTRSALQERGFQVDLVPPDAVSDDLARAFLALRVPPGSKILLPGPHEGRTVLRDALVQHGFAVTELKLYRLEQQADLPALPASVDAVVFSSPSAVSAFLESHGLPPEATVVSIGPVTSEALRSRGQPVHREAARHDIQGLIEVLL